MTQQTSLKRNWIKITGFFLGLGLFFFVLIFLNLNPEKPAVTATLAVALLMAMWWIFEVVPLSITSLLPIMGALAVSLKINPLFLMIPATISASMAFMLPVATPPNAIIFSSNRISIAQMAKTGFFLNVICAMLITLFTYYYAPVIFHISLQSMPAWGH